MNEYRTPLTGEVVYTDASGGKVRHRKIDLDELEIEATKYSLEKPKGKEILWGSSNEM